jgi:hypothetical protein
VPFWLSEVLRSLLLGDLWHLNFMFELVSNLLSNNKLVSRELSLLVSRFTVLRPYREGKLYSSHKSWHIIIKHHVYHRIMLRHVIYSCSSRFRRSWSCWASLQRRTIVGGFQTRSQSFWVWVSRRVRARQAPVHLNPTLIFTNLYYFILWFTALSN